MAQIQEPKTERNRQIVALRNSGKTLAEVGLKFGITRERVRQIVASSSPEAKAKREAYLKELKYRKEEMANLVLRKITLKDFKGTTISEITGMKSNSRDRYRELVRIRDSHTCQCCGKKWVKGMRRFDVHHEDEKMEGTNKETGKFNSSCKYDRENTDKMITYCHKCHLSLDSVRIKMMLDFRK